MNMSNSVDKQNPFYYNKLSYLNCAILVITFISNKLAKSIRLKENLKVVELAVPDSVWSKPRPPLRQHFDKISTSLRVLIQSRNLNHDNSNYLNSIIFSIFKFPDASGNDRNGLFVQTLIILDYSQSKNPKFQSFIYNLPK